MPRMGYIPHAQNNDRCVAFIGLEDDGIQGSATPIAAKNVNWIQEAVGDGLAGTKFRIRFLIEHDWDVQQGDQFAFMVSIDNSFEIRLDVASFGVRLAASDYLVNGEEAVDYVGRLGSGVWNLDDGYGDIVTGGPNRTGGTIWKAVPDITETEVEICVELVGDDLVAGQTVEIYPIKVFLEGSADFSNGYTEYPFITVAKTPTKPGHAALAGVASLEADGRCVHYADARLDGVADVVASGDRIGPQPAVVATSGAIANPIAEEAGGLITRI